MSSFLAAWTSPPWLVTSWPVPVPAQAAAGAAASGAETGGSSAGWIVTALIVVALPILGFVLGRTTRVGVIASATFKEAVRQPLFPLLLALTLVIFVVNTFLPFFSLGEDVKMLKDTGLATLLISGLLLAAWTASTAVADEIEGKTAMTLLSKPITRRQFVLGKYLGIAEAAGLFLAIAGVALLLLIYYKVGYDTKEASGTPPGWYAMGQAFGMRLPLPDPTRWGETVQVIPGLVLVFLEVAVLGAVSVAISTRLPLVVNITAIFSIFVVGHLTPVLTAADVSGRGVEVVRFVAQLIATALPNLEAFNMQAAVATGSLVPPVYLGYAALYAVAYAAGAILLAFILFEDRDLA